MSLPQCDARHKCADGGEDRCTQPQGHYGRHLCRTCLNFFSGGESIRSKAEGAETGSMREPDKQDGPGAGGGYVKDGPGAGGGYVKEGPEAGIGPVTDGPGPGGGHVIEGPGTGGGYGKEGSEAGGEPATDGPGLGGGYVMEGPGAGGGYLAGKGDRCAHCHNELTGENTRGECPRCGRLICSACSDEKCPGPDKSTS
jgi:hypothetical protein